MFDLGYNTPILNQIVDRGATGIAHGLSKSLGRLTMPHSTSQLPCVKVCSKCKETKPLGAFHKRTQSKDGRTQPCKDCCAELRRQYYQSHKAESAEQSRVWREGNHDRHIQNKRRWYSLNSDRAATYWQSYYAKHKVRLNQKNREIDAPSYYAQNRERVIGRVGAWRTANPTKARAIKHRYRSRRKNAPGSFTAEEWALLCELYGYRCLACGQMVKLTVDHIVPLSEGGSNSIDNIQPLCHSCNSSKNAKTIDFR